MEVYTKDRAEQADKRQPGYDPARDKAGCRAVPRS